jgi:hypothetical protein
MDFTRYGQKHEFEIEFENQIQLGLTGADLTGYLAYSYWPIPIWVLKTNVHRWI